MDKNQIVEIIYEAIDEINILRRSEKKIEKATTTLLFNKNSGIDSLGIVNLIIALEEKFENNFSKSLNLVEELNLEQNNNYFNSVSSLAEFLNEKIK